MLHGRAAGRRAHVLPYRSGEHGRREFFDEERRQLFAELGYLRRTACTGGSKHQSDSASVAVGWKNDTWSGDIGTTPMGFNVVDVVGGLSYSSDVGPLGYTVNLHRRPISSSLLAWRAER